MNKVYVIVKNISCNGGHGDTYSGIELAMQGMYNTEPPHPTFLSLSAAQNYIKKLNKSDLMIYILPVYGDLQ